MKLAELNEYVQTGAAVVAIVGIFLLGYEVRQSNALATQQAEAQSWTNWLSWRQSLNESGVMAVVAKSIEDPASLSLAEKGELYNYYMGWLYLYEADLEVFSYTSERVVEAMTEEAVPVLAGVFSTPYARAWLTKSQFEFRGDPSLKKRIVEFASTLPEDLVIQFYRDVDAKLAESSQLSK